MQQRTLTPAPRPRFLCAWPSQCRAAAPWAHCPPAARPPARPLPILAGILLPRSCLWALVFAKRNEGAPITGTAVGARARCTARSGQPGKGSSSCQGAHSPYGLFCPSLRGKRKRARPGDRSRFFFHGGAPRPTEATAAPARRSGRPPCCGFSPSPSSPVCPLASPLALPGTSKSQASGQRAGLEKFSRWDPPSASHLPREGRAHTHSSYCNFAEVHTRSSFTGACSDIFCLCPAVWCVVCCVSCLSPLIRARSQSDCVCARVLLVYIAATRV